MIDLALVCHGPGVSVATVRAWCPRVPRATIRALLIRLRLACRAALTRVSWTQAGRVWAVDFAEPPQPLDSRYRAILHIRDLASGFRLAALPVPQPTARAALVALRATCARWGAPLVLKVDNGSAFISTAFAAWARDALVALLYSPPLVPRYNGGIEASIGALATRAHHEAAWHGHPEYWTTEDIEIARHQANEAAGDARSPAAHWHRRRAITPRERARFLAGVQATYARLVAEHAQAYSAPMRMRVALVCTLQHLGYVTMTRRAEFVH